MKNKVIENRDIVIGTLGVLLIFLGITGNVLVVIAVWKKRSLRSTTNYLLVNLAVSDIVNLTFIPLIAIPSFVQLDEGPLADFLCIFFVSYHVPLTASFVSILTLLVLSVERYHAVVKPMRTGIRLQEETIHYALFALWISCTGLTLPYYIYGHHKDNKCQHNVSRDDMKIYVMIVFSMVVVIPFFIITFCYLQIVREMYLKPKQVGPQNVALAEDILLKRRLVKLSLCVTFAYAICFFPLVITLFLKTYDDKYDSKNFKNASVLYFLESAVNPFLYAFQSTNFRQAFKEILRCRPVQ